MFLLLARIGQSASLRWPSHGVLWVARALSHRVKKASNLQDQMVAPPVHPPRSMQIKSPLAGTALVLLGTLGHPPGEISSNKLVMFHGLEAPDRQALAHRPS